MGTTRFNWENLATWVKQAEETDPPDEPGQKFQHGGTKKCKSCGAKMSGSSVLSECPKCAGKKGTINRSDLVKVGGLFRIRDNYETVWKMEAGEDGRPYIIRVGEDGGEERFLVAEDNPTENYSKAAYRTLVAGQVHIVWECDQCNAPNITKEGNTYECDDCHKQYHNVLSAHPQPEVYDRATAGAEFGDWIVERMKREGINKINRDLIEVWAESVKKGECPDCGDVVPFDMRDKHKKVCPAKKAAHKLVASKCGECGCTPSEDCGDCQCHPPSAPARDKEREDFHSDG